MNQAALVMGILLVLVGGPAAAVGGANAYGAIQAGAPVPTVLYALVMLAGALGGFYGGRLVAWAFLAPAPGGFRALATTRLTKGPSWVSTLAIPAGLGLILVAATLGIPAALGLLLALSLAFDGLILALTARKSENPTRSAL